MASGAVASAAGASRSEDRSSRGARRRRVVRAGFSSRRVSCSSSCASAVNVSTGGLLFDSAVAVRRRRAGLRVAAVVVSGVSSVSRRRSDAMRSTSRGLTNMTTTRLGKPVAVPCERRAPNETARSNGVSVRKAVQKSNVSRPDHRDGWRSFFAQRPFRPCRRESHEIALADENRSATLTACFLTSPESREAPQTAGSSTNRWSGSNRRRQDPRNAIHHSFCQAQTRASTERKKSGPSDSIRPRRGAADLSLHLSPVFPTESVRENNRKPTLILRVS